MWISKRSLTLVLVASMAATSLVVAVGASGHRDHGDRHGNRHARGLLDAALAPSQPSDPTFHGVAPGNVPWVLDRGNVEIRRHGLRLRVRGLVIPDPPGDGTPGQVDTVSTSLYCGPDSDTTAADTTQAVPLSDAGNARIRDRSFDVPATCLAPVVLVHPNGNPARYIAVDGRR